MFIGFSHVRVICYTAIDDLHTPIPLRPGSTDLLSLSVPHTCPRPLPHFGLLFLVQTAAVVLPPCTLLLFVLFEVRSQVVICMDSCHLA